MILIHPQELIYAFLYRSGFMSIKSFHKDFPADLINQSRAKTHLFAESNPFSTYSVMAVVCFQKHKYFSLLVNLTTELPVAFLHCKRYYLTLLIYQAVLCPKLMFFFHCLLTMHRTHTHTQNTCVKNSKNTKPYIQYTHIHIATCP